MASVRARRRAPLPIGAHRCRRRPPPVPPVPAGAPRATVARQRRPVPQRARLISLPLGATVARAGQLRPSC
ncbi:MAG TPA: hypothetical protein VEJ84_02575, partial [Acidimicrobiales bacterium]|nr:hypothetical protein [Acidimicrobiales bacterium]